MLIISCLSQKGGVGKSTFSQLIATTYANSGWSVKIADFNTFQKSSADWVAWRQEQKVEPEVAAETFTSMTAVLRQADRYDLIVIDGRPDADQTQIEIARHSSLIVIPVGVSLTALKPSILFAHELQSRGISRDRLLFALNLTGDSEVAVNEARDFISSAGYNQAKTDIPSRTAYHSAQSLGRAIAETPFKSLNARAEALMEEIVNVARPKEAA